MCISRNVLFSKCVYQVTYCFQNLNKVQNTNIPLFRLKGFIPDLNWVINLCGSSDIEFFSKTFYDSQIFS